MGTITGAVAGGNWSVGASWVGGVAPGTGDDVLLTATSGNITIDLNTNVCRSLNCTGYTGTLTHTAAITLTIGDGTAGLSSVALTLVSGMTYTLGNTSTSAINFVSTSSTQQTVDFGGKSCASLTFNGVAGSWQLSSAITTAQTATANIKLTAGTLDTNGNSVTTGQFNISGSTARTLTLGASSLNMASGAGGLGGVWDATTTTNLTFNVGTSTITVSGGNQTAQGGGLTYNNFQVTASGGGRTNLAGTNTFANLTLLGSSESGGTNLSGDQTVTGLLTISGSTSVAQSHIQSSVPGTARTITAATVSVSNNNIRDIIAAGASAPWSTTNTGDMGGNSNITFTSPVTRYWVASSGGSWNTTGSWSTSSGGASGASIPLPQDTAVFDSNSITSGGRTITLNHQCTPTVNLSNILNTPTIAQLITNGAQYIKGDLVYASGLTITGTSSVIMAGRGSQIITSAGNTISNPLFIESVGGTYTLQDNLTLSFNTGTALTLTIGTLSAGTANVSLWLFNSNNSNVRVLNMGSGTWSANGTGTLFSFTSGTNLTFNAQTSTVSITDTSSTDKTFASGASRQWNNVTITAGGTGKIIFPGSTLIASLTMSNGPKTLQFQSGSTFTLGVLSLTGSVSNIITIASSTPASFHTLTKPSGIVNCDYLSIQDSHAIGGAGWYAGHNSTNVSGNTGWIFASGFTSALSASLSYSAALTKKTSKGLSASISYIGSITKNTRKILASSLSYSGNFVNHAIRRVILNSSLNYSGAVVRLTSKKMVSALSYTGAVNKITSKTLTATVSYLGSVSKLLKRTFSASASFLGSLTNSFIHLPVTYVKNFTASLTMIGGVAKVTSKTFTASISLLDSFIAQIMIVSKYVPTTLPFVGTYTQTPDQSIGNFVVDDDPDIGTFTPSP